MEDKIIYIFEDGKVPVGEDLTVSHKEYRVSKRAQVDIINGRFALLYPGNKTEIRVIPNTENWMVEDPSGLRKFLDAYYG